MSCWEILKKGGPPFSQTAPDSNGWLQIIGVAADARDDGLRKPIRSAVFLPFTLHMQMWTQILVELVPSRYRS